jgi:2-keto-4-pentenoate hydratase/2-oxohepta-3-ene-1,7-dioic acid hydratase in catechol pathway
MKQYKHQWLEGKACPWPVGKVVCIGRNYAEHAKELQNPIPDEPLLFIKPASSIQYYGDSLALPADKGEIHYETELALLVGETITAAHSPRDMLRAIAGLGLGLDFTLRGLQAQLKAKGHPWEKAKAFDGACALTGFTPVAVNAADYWQFSCEINGQLRQSGDSRQMLFNLPALLPAIVSYFSLQPGDIVLTGTPAGVGPVTSGDQIHLRLNSLNIDYGTVNMV